jgi:hypothetical protein
MSDNVLTSPARGKRQAAKVRKLHPELEPPAEPLGPEPPTAQQFSLSIMVRMEEAWKALESARKDAAEKRQASHEADERLRRRRDELESLFRSLFERRPLFDALADEE